MKKVLCFCLVLFAGILLFAACSKGSKSSDAGTLNVFIWTEYIPESVIKAFEAETGIKTNVSVYSSNEDMLAKVKRGKGIYDIAVPSDYMVERMAREGLLAKVDKSKLENLKNLDPIYMNRSFDKGNEHSIPFMAGGATIIINKRKVKEDIKSFKQLFDPKYAKSIVILDDYRVIIGAVAMSLGYKLDPENDEQLEKVAARLMELKPNIKLRDSDSPKTAMLNAETSIGYIWNAEIAICIQENPSDFAVIYPDEGSYLFIDSFVILDGAKNQENALKFIDFILRPEISAQISAEFPYTNPNKAAIALLTDDYKKNMASNMPPQAVKKGQFPKSQGINLQKYDEIWTRFIK